MKSLPDVPILFENDDVVVINKPAGLVVHSDGKSNEVTLVDWILKTYPKIEHVGEPLMIGDTAIPRPGIVHRLDRETSGVLIVAKTDQAFQSLKEQFQNHTIQKEYHAFIYGSPKETTGIIDAPIGRSGGDIRKWATGRSARGVMREAVTEFNVLKRYGLPEGEEKGSTEPGIFTYVACFPKTGRTHQLRVHFKHINHPIVCDSLYAPHRERGLGFERLALHAYKIIFALPTGETQTLEAPFPADFKAARIAIGVESC